MDYALVGFLTALWAMTLVLVYGLGWVAGHATATDNHRWNRWLLRKIENRSTRI
jgi:hypothetical protein